MVDLIYNSKYDNNNMKEINNIESTDAEKSPKTVRCTYEDYQKAIYYANILNDPNADYIENLLARAAKKFIKLNTDHTDRYNDLREDILFDNCILGDRKEIIYSTVTTAEGTVREKQYTPDGEKKVREQIRGLLKKEIDVTPYICNDKELILSRCTVDMKECLNGFLFVLDDDEVLSAIKSKR